MGGAAGHLSHLHENLDFTFGEIKSILSQVASAEMEAVEKVDGQNIFFTYNAENGEVRTARNVGDIKKGGMTPSAMMDKFTNHPAGDAFINGFRAIESAVGSLGGDQSEAIFGDDGDYWVNAEIMYPANPNIIHYDGNYIVMHGANTYDRNTGAPIGKAPESFGALVAAVKAAEDIEGDFSVTGPQLVAFNNIAEGTAFQDFVSALAAAAPGAGDDTTMGEYVSDRLRQGEVGNLPIPVNKQEGLIKRIVGAKNAPSLTDLKKGVPKEIQKKISALGTKTNSRKTISRVIGPVENAISDFAVEVMRGLQSFFVSEHDTEIQRMREELESSIQALESYEGADAEKIGEMLSKQAEKLGPIENIASTMEGVVFEYPPGSDALYKLTGSFAMANQLVGRAKRLPSEESQKNERVLRNYIRMAFLAG